MSRLQSSRKVGDLELHLTETNNFTTPRNSIVADKPPSIQELPFPVEDPHVRRDTFESTRSLSPAQQNSFTFPSQTYTPPQPSLRLLFTFTNRRMFFTTLLPAMLISVIAGGVAPFMTFVLGQGFQAFSTFASSPNPDSNQLLHQVGIASLELVALAVAAVILSSAMSSLWILVAERNVLGVRRYVYEKVVGKEMEWFDLNMRADKSDYGSAANDSNTDATSGAAGLMAKFSKETDEIRTATSLPLGLVLQNTVTVLSALALAFRGSWSLTLLTFSPIPFIIFFQGLSSGKAQAELTNERNILAQCADHADRSFKTIETVKAFNAQDRELDQLEYFLQHLTKAVKRLGVIWGLANGASQFAAMSTFGIGFWFGSFLVRTGRNTPGEVMGVFWACLIASNNLQIVFPHLATLQRGKQAMVSLLNLVNTPLPQRPSLPPPASDEAKQYSELKSPKLISLPASYPINFQHSQTLRKIVPPMTHICRGAVNLMNVTFAYPTRPLDPVLKNLTMFFPAHETTYVVGPSGSGKSSIAALLTRCYEPNYGTIELDDQLLNVLDEDWTRERIFHLGQGTILFEGTVEENVAIARRGGAGRAEVIAACRASLLHEFVRDLPDGYDTMLGSGGHNLSGGQRQRLAIARARIRDPDVLILDEATSALDPTSRSLIIAALKVWRRNRTTIVITHDLGPDIIAPHDFVYVMHHGTVAEQGYRSDLDKSGDIWKKMIRERDCESIIESVPPMSPINNLPKISFLPDIEEDEEEEEDATQYLWNHLARNHQSDNLLGLGGNGLRSVSRASWNSVVEFLGNRPSSPSPEPTIKPNRRISLQAPPPQPEQLQSPERSMDVIPGEAISMSLTYPQPAAINHDRRTRYSTATEFGFHKPLRMSAYSHRPSSIYSTAFTEADGEDGEHYHPFANPANYPSPNEVPARPPLSLVISELSYPAPSQRHHHHRNASVMSDTRSIVSQTETLIEDASDDEADVDDEFEEEKKALQMMAKAASEHRYHGDNEKEGGRPRTRITHHSTKTSGSPKKLKKSTNSSATVEADPVEDLEAQKEPQVKLSTVLLAVYHTVPSKPLLFAGMTCCVISGAMTPLFSFLLSRLLFEVSTGARDVSIVNIYGAIIISIAFADGFFNCLKSILMQFCSASWIEKLRTTVYTRVLMQDKKWFDRPENASEKLVHTLFKDGEDARVLINNILGQALVVFAMLGMGLIWALVLGWQLTLAGFAIGPVFAGVMSIQATLVSKFERRNKNCKEEIAKGYYETISNIRGIRSMAFEGVFRSRFEKSLSAALHTGVKGAFVEGCNIGVASGLIYLAEGLLFWVGAVLVGRRIYTYMQMVQVLQLVVFSVSIASQLMAFTGGISKAMQATRDLHRLLTLSDKTDESHGSLQPPIDGGISFRDVRFSYPERPSASILKGINFDVRHGECIAIVGGSGSGKSTIISLLQRLYNPTSGKVTVEGTDLGETDVAWLRDHVSIVSQNPHLFDMTVIDNIAYGSRPVSDEEAYQAARACNAEEFILNLPDAYETQLGTNADLLSGGQAQRLAIARALVRGAKVLVLDECTSALDVENQAFVMESIRKIKEGRTIIMITHKIPIMRMCDRILVVQDGIIAEEGSYETLLTKRGVFTQLANGGTWSSE